MLADIVEVRPLDGHQLYLRFEDGTEGFINVAELVQPIPSFETKKL